MTVIEPLGHHELFLVVAQLAVLLFVARALGEAFSSIGQPAVVGELLAGVVLGPSILGVVAPGLYAGLFEVSPAQFHLLEIVSWIGLIMLLVVTGLETDIDLIVSKGRTAIILSLGGILVPFATGFGLGWILPVEFIAAPEQRLVFSLFIATAMSISAIPVIAKVLIELDVIRRDIGQLILAAGMVDDTLGWILLATVAGLARSGVVDVNAAVTTILSVVVFLGVAFTVGRRLVSEIVRWVDNVIGGEASMITALMVLALSVGAITQYMGLEAILGAFVVGILVGQVKRFDYHLRHTFEVMTLGVFAPIFFAIAGLRMDVASLADPTVLAVGLIVLGVACFGKFAGIVGAARLAGLSRWEGITIGGGMNARGAMEIIVATIGLGLGILTSDMYSIIVMVAIVTSLMAPAIMRWSIPKIEMTDDERRRLELEGQQRRSFVGGLTTVLLPTRCSTDSQFAARLAGSLSRGQGIEVTSMYLERGDGGERGALAPLRSLFGRRTRAARGDGGTAPNDRNPDGNGPAGRDGRVDANGGDDSRRERADRCRELMERRLDLPRSQTRSIVRAERTSAKDTVIREAGEGYDMLVLGASERGTRADAPLFSATIDEIIRDAPCPVLVASTNRDEAGARSGDDRSVRRILLPTVGAEYNHHAAEVAYTIARDQDAVVDVVHVVAPPQVDDVFVDRPGVESGVRLGERIVEEEAAPGRQLGVAVDTNVIVGEREPEKELTALTRTEAYDLVLLGSSLRPLTGRAFFGHRVEYVFKHAACPVAVLASM
ncbi:cation:proton antiporter domain-containing protein [Natrinema salifodinae]|uniref:Transporter, CPA2 family n=1 Tax=Natrinema salifodinae TaxID=1202768 RepID=A0A1I0NJQ6_9EURY|nr:cation:proton antiporter [Natrinema salifodinae]SEW01404.1 transporter, CPA2 family [Natrinema salifodinae]